jgi:hypothetical protein
MKGKIFLILILGELILTGFSPWQKRVSVDPSNKDVFIAGKLSFKKEKFPTIRFWIEGDAGYYSVIIYGIESSHVKKVSKIVADAFKSNVSDSTSCYVFRYEGINYSIIDFDNKKTDGLRGFKLIPLGLRVVKEIESKTRGKASGHIVW